MTWHVLPEHHAAVCLTHLPPIPGVEALRERVGGHPVTIVKHDLPTWQRLREAGLILPAPLPARWPGRFQPRSHQLATIEHLLQHRRAFVLNGLGTGKTLSAIWAANYLMDAGLVRRVLVVAPMSIHHHVWERELFQTLTQRKAVVLSGARQRKLRLAHETRIEWLVVNPESLFMLRSEDLPAVDLILVDEFTKFKNARSQRWKALRGLADGRRLWLMSGTPAPQSPLDAHGPIKLVRQDCPGYLRWRDLTMRQVTKFRWEARESSADTIARWMQPAVRYRREDCYDMPEVQVERVEVDLSAEQQTVIKGLQKQASIGLRGVQITAANAAGVLSKIMQVCAGAVYDAERQAHAVDASPYFDAVEEIVEQADTPVLVFNPYRSGARALYDHLHKAGFKVGLVTGDTPKSARAPLFDQVQHGTLDALVAVAGTMSHGLTLTTARYVLWTAPPFGFEEYEQANGRVIRDGQKNAVTIYQLVQTPLAKRLFERLESKAKLQDIVLELIAQFANGEGNHES